LLALDLYGNSGMGKNQSGGKRRYGNYDASYMQRGGVILTLANTTVAGVEKTLYDEIIVWKNQGDPRWTNLSENYFIAYLNELSEYINDSTKSKPNDLPTPVAGLLPFTDIAHGFSKVLYDLSAGGGTNLRDLDRVVRELNKWKNDVHDNIVITPIAFTDYTQKAGINPLGGSNEEALVRMLTELEVIFTPGRNTFDKLGEYFEKMVNEINTIINARTPQLQPNYTLVKNISATSPAGSNEKLFYDGIGKINGITTPQQTDYITYVNELISAINYSTKRVNINLGGVNAIATNFATVLAGPVIGAMPIHNISFSKIIGHMSTDLTANASPTKLKSQVIEEPGKAPLAGDFLNFSKAVNELKTTLDQQEVDAIITVYDSLIHQIRAKKEDEVLFAKGDGTAVTIKELKKFKKALPLFIQEVMQNAQGPGLPTVNDAAIIAALASPAVIAAVKNAIDATYVKNLVDQAHVRTQIDKAFIEVRTQIDKAFIESLVDQAHVRTKIDKPFIEGLVDQAHVRGKIDKPFIEGLVDSAHVSSSYDADLAANPLGPNIRTKIQDLINNTVSAISGTNLKGFNVDDINEGLKELEKLKHTHITPENYKKVNSRLDNINNKLTPIDNKVDVLVHALKQTIVTMLRNQNRRDLY
jgi:hypothetical protein